MQRHIYYFRGLAQQEKNKEEGQRNKATEDPENDEDSLESSEWLVDDTNPNTTLLINWWLEGLRPGDSDSQ